MDGDAVYNHDALDPAPLKHPNGPVNVAPVVHEREAALDGMAELAHQARLVVQQEDEFAPHEAALDLEDEQAEEADAVEPVEAGNAPQAGNQLLDPPLVMDDEPFGDDEMVNALEGEMKITDRDSPDPILSSYRCSWSCSCDLPERWTRHSCP